MIVPNYYENLQVLHENTMPYRAYYIPASKPMGALVDDREKSDRFQLLNGSWKFRFYKSIYDLQEKFYEEETLTEAFDEIPVPGIWQNYGYDNHQYTNVRYPIPLDPPYVPQENPCGAYIHEFDYSKDEKAPKAYLNFEGVDSCFYVWMNGWYVGYSQVSHATAEFDVTDYMRDGKNCLAVLVLKWCDGTYLEDQDKFRMTGIFRDVYILKRPENILYDYFTTTKINGTEAKIEIRANFVGEGNIAERMQILLKDKEGTSVCEGHFEPVTEENGYTHRAIVTIKNPYLWNPEQPYLYQLILFSDVETVVDRVGIREISRDGSIIYMNPAFDEIEEYMKEQPDKPLLLVEYCHAMGNGPGDLEDYFGLIQKYDSLCGGFVWEWCDHAIDEGVAENGKRMYYYGGDHGEEIHDGNFCMLSFREEKMLNMTGRMDWER